MHYHDYDRHTGLCRCGSDDGTAMYKRAPFPPDPNNFQIIKVMSIGNYTIAKVLYPNAVNFEGRKIMVFKGLSVAELESLGSLDPHFSESKTSPIARFKPDEDGWYHAIRFVDGVTADYVPLFQEALRKEPFWMLLACSLVNLTHWRQAQPVFDYLYGWCHGMPEMFCLITEEQLQNITRSLGMQNRRARTMREFGQAWKDIEDPFSMKRDDIMKLPGCGRYASDSWAIFMEEDLTVEPKDGRLNEYLEHERKNGSASE